ncbi:MAG: patatin-like phospholipase family protein [Nitrospira sp.]|nr:patatin-like phospholipase family protein [Nitrospira sp.]
MTNSQEQGPYSLARVLEEEYAALHGPLPAGPPAASESERLASAYARIHGLPRRQAALCLSGGGIRSATFALGVIQGLAKLKLLDRFDYLSTVSGGGYIGSWLSAWIKNHRRGLAGVEEELQQPPQPDCVEPLPVAYLRAYSNYLSPRLGFMSADSWTLVGTYLRNLVLNWLVFIPFLLAGLAVPLLYRAALRSLAPDLLAGFCAFLGSTLLLVSLVYLHLCRPSLWKLRTSPSWRRFESQPAFLGLCLAPLLLGVASLSFGWYWHLRAERTVEHMTLNGWSSLTTFWVGGALMHTLAWLTAALVLRRPWNDLWRYLELLTIVLSGLLGGSLLWLTLAKSAPLSGLPRFEDWYTCAAVPGFLSLFLLAASVFIGIASRSTGDDDREWWGRSGSWVLIATVSWTGICGIVLFGPLVLAQIPGWITSAGGVTGLVTIALGFSARTAGQPEQERPNLWAKIATKGYVLLLAPLTIVLVLMALATLNSAVLHSAPLLQVGAYIAGLALFAVLMSFYININKFSLHAMYRNRLIRAYLGASRGTERTPNLFTGFDSHDNFQMAELAPVGAAVQRPFHVVNIALNLVHGNNLAWQQRKAQSFTASPLHCGSGNMIPGGYRPTREYGKNPAVGQAITIGTALAISGAAASPNMGYHSSPAVTLLLTLFNIRLGWWLGNPGEAGRTAYRRSCPEFAVGPLLSEAFGLTNDERRYVYLSDGGHFENLALYEMVRRRCRVIVVSDAGCDQLSRFSDLGNAIRKIRIDLGIEIELDVEKLRRKAGSPFSERRHVVGRIRYDLVDPGATSGLLLYLKPSLTGQEPTDILDYAASHPAFPHESTADQFFDESQFESYRKLGLYTVNEVFLDAAAETGLADDRLFDLLHSHGSG